MPGQPGTAPDAPSVPISSGEPSATTRSAPPCVHSTGGLGSRSTMSAQRQYRGDSALRMPDLPGAKPGQFSEAVASPG